MATTYPAILIGGPCEGVVRQVTATQLQNGRIWCQGALYVYVKGGAGDYRYAFQLYTDYQKALGNGSELTAFHAWARWMRALGHSGPRAHNRIQRSTARVRRIARKR